MEESNELHSLVLRLSRIRMQIAELKDEEADTKDRLNELLSVEDAGTSIECETPGGTFITMKVVENSTFNAKAAKANLTPSQYARILAPTPNAKLAREILGENYHKAQIHNGVKYVISYDTGEDDE